MDRATIAYVALGSNLGDKRGYIDKAVAMLSQTGQTRVVGVSDLGETEPLGAADHPKYLNGVAEVETGLTAQELYKRMAEIETALGRERPDQWSPRTIDLDLLLFGDEVIDTADLTVPHPQMHLRSFVLSGVCQLNGGLLHPVLREPMSVLAGRLGGCDFALDPERVQLICVAGIIGAGKTTLAQRLSESLGCAAIFEAYDKNPFLADVYGGQRDLALDSQLFFLSSRIEQLSGETLGSGNVVVTDYVFDKELIYAGCLLDARQLGLYEKLYARLQGEVAGPVLVIYLEGGADTCLERIRRRNRPYEQGIEVGFLEELGLGYERLFADWKRCPVIRICTSDFDSRQSEDIRHLRNQVTSYVAS
ncbi:MAG: 2-amino-4-hydroxy-6-hydroxymethyldihydropteridine diphosphokinase [Planctomycetota bacterium]|jgi:2-amino-4-hydroxy-6-hydroxymethyldihydropteridine diphosphokinase